MRFLLRLSEVRGIQWHIGMLGLGLSAAFTFLIYPAIAGPDHAVLDPDFHGPLGFGLWKLHTFSYYPDSIPTTARGPLYPAFIAAMLAATDGWWPYSVQAAQCALFGLGCVLAFWVANTLWNRQLAVLAAGLCALDPYLIWYSSRIWVEPLMIFLFTALIAAVVLVKRRPSVWTALLVGVIVGLSIMTKSVYAPFLVLTPALLALPFGARLKPALVAAVLVAGALVVAPWTIRNGRLTGIYAPEVGNTGFTLHQGNDFVQDFHRAPFSVSALHVISVARIKEEADSVDFPPDFTLRQRLLALDAARRRTAIDKMLGSPGFF
ncbi:MAG TPA: hypothetical protein VHV81_06410, partial [Steroidobacteraceae bacterium]|nr:hypothetical protein [Steroidobacteraceae bacterium]